MGEERRNGEAVHDAELPGEEPRDPSRARTPVRIPVLHGPIPHGTDAHADLVEIGGGEGIPLDVVGGEEDRGEEGVEQCCPRCKGQFRGGPPPLFAWRGSNEEPEKGGDDEEEEGDPAEEGCQGTEEGGHR